MKQSSVYGAPSVITLLVLLVGITDAGVGGEDEAIPIAEITHDGPVDFQKEILPILRRNCLACHNSTKKEGGLVLETPESIRKGGSSGPAVVPGKPLESNLLLQASRRQESYMPPDNNDVGARPLTPEQLGLVKLWIEQGATGQVTATANSIAWQPLPPGVSAIYALSMTADARFLAAARANQIFLYHVPSQRELGRLTDPQLLKLGIYSKPGVADLDMIQSLAFSGDGNWLVSGGYRTAKIWQRQRNVRIAELPRSDHPLRALATSGNGRWIVVGDLQGQVRWIDRQSGAVTALDQPHNGAVTGVALSPTADRCVSIGQDATWRLFGQDGVCQAVIHATCPLTAVAWLSDQLLVTAGSDHQLYLWDATTAVEAAKNGEGKAEALAVLSGHSQPVTCLVRIDSQRVLSGSLDGSVRLWDVMNKKVVKQVGHERPVVAVAASSDGKWWVSASKEGNSVRIWNSSDGKLVHELQRDPGLVWQRDVQAREAALAKRLVELAIADVNQAKERIKSEENNRKQAEDEKNKAAEELAKKKQAAEDPVAKKEAVEKELAELQKALTQAEQEKTPAAQQIAVLQKQQPTLEETFKKANEKLAEAVQSVNDVERQLKVARDAAEQAPDDEEKAKAVKELELALTKAKEQQQVAEEAKKVAEQRLGEVVQKIQQTGEQLKKLETTIADVQRRIKLAEEKVKQLTPAAQKALDEVTAAQRAWESAERAWQRAVEAVQRAQEAVGPLEEIVATKQKEQQQAEERARQAAERVSQSPLTPLAVAFAPDSRTLAISCQDHTVRFFDAPSGTLWNVVDALSAVGNAVQFLDHETLLVASEEGTLTAWLAHPQWQWYRTIGDPNDPSVFVDRVTAVEIDSQGQLVATATGEPSRSGQIYLWNLATGELVRRVEDAHTDEIFAMRFSRDGRYLASCSADRFVKVFEVASGKWLRSFEGHTHHVLGVAWSADGRQLSSSGADKVIKVWNTQTGEQQRTIQGFGKEVTAILYVGDSPDQVVACSGDASIQVKNTSNGNNVRNLPGASDFVYSIAVSADGKWIAAGGQDSIVRVWKSDGQLFAAFPPPAQ